MAVVIALGVTRSHRMSHYVVEGRGTNLFAPSTRDPRASKHNNVIFDRSQSIDTTSPRIEANLQSHITTDNKPQTRAQSITGIMDPLEELNRMADNASALRDDDLSEEDIKRWASLFKYTYLEAFQLLKSHRSDITRDPIADEHWELIRADREAAGYDREAYEHSLALKDVLRSQSTVVHDADGLRWTLYRLGGLLESGEKVREICGSEEEPKVTEGLGENGYSRFVWVDDEGAKKIESWIEEQGVLGRAKGSSS